MLVLFGHLVEQEAEQQTPSYNTYIELEAINYFFLAVQ